MHAALQSTSSFLFDFECSLWPVSFFEFLASRCFEAISLVREAKLPIKPSEHSASVLRALVGSTRGLSKKGHAFEACQHVLRIMESMSAGQERAHLRKLVDLVDFRGSDVWLDSGAIVEGARQAVPYSAFASDFACVQSYRWLQPQHINVLELLAFPII